MAVGKGEPRKKFLAGSLKFVPLKALAFIFVILFFALFGVSSALANELYVSPDGNPGATGEIGDPLDIVTALTPNIPIAPGTTIWLRGGVYNITGANNWSLSGTENDPIIVRQYPGERATLDTGDSHFNLIAIYGAHTWYWGFEVTSSGEDRWHEDTKGGGIDVYGSQGIKLINLVHHNTRQHIGAWSTALNTEIYGCLIFFNGFDGPQRGRAHAIYAQNSALNNSEKRILDNIMFAQYSYGLHAYTEGGRIDNFIVEGNIAFNSGVLSTISGGTTQLLVGGGRVALNPVARNNYTYVNPGQAGTGLDFGYGEGVSNAIVQDNYIVGRSRTAFALKENDTPTVKGNTVFGLTSGFNTSTYPDNDFRGLNRPTGTLVFVRPNIYEVGRANIAVYNWDEHDTVDVDLSSALSIGDSYTIVDAENFFGDPVAVGIYDGNPVTLPMTLTDTTPVIGTPATPYNHTPKEFNAFVLLSDLPVGTFPLQVRSTPILGVEIASETGHDGVTNYTRHLDPDDYVELEAPLFVGSGDDRKRFAGWTGSVSSSEREISLTMNSSKNVTVNYEDYPEPPLYSVWGVNQSHSIYARVGVTMGEPKGVHWQWVPGTLSYLSIGSDCVWGVNRWGSIFYRDNLLPGYPTEWQLVPGYLNQISVGPTGAVWGTQTWNGQIYVRTGITEGNPTGDGWTRAPGSLVYVAVGEVGVWGVNANGRVYYRHSVINDGTPWVLVPGALSRISISPLGDAWGVNPSGQIYMRKGITPGNPTGTHWQMIPGRLTDLAGGSLWGVNQNGHIYFRPSVTDDGTPWEWVRGNLVQLSCGGWNFPAMDADEVADEPADASNPDETGTDDGAFDETPFLVSPGESAVVSPKRLPPVADAGGDRVVKAGELVVFSGQGSYAPDGEIVLYEWDLTRDDMFESRGLKVTTVFQSPGRFTIRLRVTDDAGAAGEDSARIEVRR